MVVLLATLLALGLLALVRLARGLDPLPAGIAPSQLLGRWRTNGAGHPGGRDRALAAGLAAAVVVLLVSRNLVFAVVAGAGVVLWPMLAGGGRAERAALDKLEGLALWTESLRDLAQRGAGLESVIPKTVPTAPPVLGEPLRLLARRLSVKVPLPEALSLFADEVDDASADMVVAALALAARQRRGRLSDVLTALSRALRDELEQRTKVMRERNVIRREAAQVAALTAVLVLAANLFAPPALTTRSGDGRNGSGAAALLPLMLAAGYVFVFSRVRRLAEPETEPRFLSSATEVLQAATYRPRTTELR